jgi:hypothetical protein
MVRSLTLAFATACAVAAVSAQAPAQNRSATDPPAAQQATPSPPPQQPAAQSSQASDTSKVTMTGCLKPGATAGTWTLETAPIPSAAGTTASSPVGTSGANAKRTYNLSAKPSDDLKPHANHKIEVVGTVTPTPASSAAAGAPASDTGSDAAPRLTFNVESFKMVSPSCQ